MRLGQIVLRIRTKKTRFGNYIGGAAELELSIKNTLIKDMAFVIPLAENSPENTYDNTINQKITERFGVIVALANDVSQSEKFGFTAYDQLHDVRNELFIALLGWTPLDAESQVCYIGGKIIDINNAYLWYQFEFQYTSRIVIGDSGGGEIQTGEMDDTEEPVDFNTIYMQLINTPDARIPYTGTMPYQDNFPDVALPNMANWIDFTINPDAAEFGKGFGTSYDI
jgi:hypothetical protein